MKITNLRILICVTILISTSVNAEIELSPTPPLPDFDASKLFPPNDEESSESNIISRLTSGIWYNPHHDGEGFFIHIDDEVIPRFTVTWYTFDKNGEQMWLIGTTRFRYGVKEIEVMMKRPRGTQFGHLFNSNAVNKKNWGKLTFSFDNCKEGAVIYGGHKENVAGYGAGFVPIIQLADNPDARCPLYANPVDSPVFIPEEDETSTSFNGLGTGTFTSSGTHQKAGIKIIKERLFMQNGDCHLEITVKNKSGKNHAAMAVSYELLSNGVLKAASGFAFRFTNEGQTKTASNKLFDLSLSPSNCSNYDQINITGFEADAF